MSTSGVTTVGAGSAPHRTSARVAPRQGWRAASKERRALAVLAPLFVGVLVVPGEGPGGNAEGAAASAGVLLQLLLVPMLHALARVLRPYRSSSPPRGAVARHWAAATAVAFGAVPAAMLTTGAPLVGWVDVYVAVPALLLGVVTLLWGLIEVASRD